MPKKRVYELAKELSLTTKELTNILEKQGIKDKKTMSSLSEDEISKVTGFFKKDKPPVKTAASPQQQQAKTTPSTQRPKPASENRPNNNRPPYQNRENRPSYQNRENRPAGSRPPYQNRENRPAGSSRPTHQNREGQSQNRENRPAGSRPPYQNRDNQSRDNRPAGNTRPPYQNNRPRPSTTDKPREGDKPAIAPKPANTRRPSTPPPKTGTTSKDRSSNKPTGKQFEEKRANKYKKFGEPTATQIKKDKRKAKEKREKEERLKHEAEMAAKENDIKTIQVGDAITVKELAEKLGKNMTDVITPLMKIGIMANATQEIDFYTATNIAEMYDVLVEPLNEIDLLEEEFGAEDEEENTTPRPPVVVVMGHVDHGKTSLLDAIRSANQAEGEAGGITQKIGAYQVSTSSGPITFLDTPGHEAFTAMRMRGAKITDIAVLVVAADDGVMPQTVEAINHAKAAEVEIIVAINKIDKPGANPDRVKQELSEHGILSEEWGGSHILVPVSAKQRTGITELLDTILLVAELKELKSNPSKKARGTVIEASLDRGRGPVATILIQSGTLRVGDPIVAGLAHGKVRAMSSYDGTNLKKLGAGPSTPIEITGLGEVPKAGDTLYVANDEKHAASVAATMKAKSREDMLKGAGARVSLDDLMSQIREGNMKELNVLIKAEAGGSVEAVRSSLEKLSNEEVRIKIIHGGVGNINESDIMLASTSGAIVIGFNVSNSAKGISDSEGVDVRLYKVIYSAIEDIKNAMDGMLDPVYEEKIIGSVEIRQLFKANNTSIAGSYVLEGYVTRNSKVRIKRAGKLLHDGEIAALRRFQDDVKEVKAGYECGITFEKYNDIAEGDIVEVYIMEEVKR